MTIVGHKFYAPKGISVLYIRNGVKLEKLMHGANHERNITIHQIRTTTLQGIY